MMLTITPSLQEVTDIHDYCIFQWRSGDKFALPMWVLNLELLS